jgi:hypothetical protein
MMKNMMANRFEAGMMLSATGNDTKEREKPAMRSPYEVTVRPSV